jgi:addiction module HigA family antidote
MKAVSPTSKQSEIVMSTDSEHGVRQTRVDDAPPAPGLVIRRDILDRFRISQADLARLTGVSRAQIHHFLNGRNPISAEFALCLGKVTATDPAYWMDLNSRFDLHQKRLEMKEKLDKMVALSELADVL